MFKWQATTNRGVLGSKHLRTELSQPHVDWTGKSIIQVSTNIITCLTTIIFVMNFVPWTAAHRSWSIGRLQLTNLIACVEYTKPYIASDPLATAVPSSTPSSPKKMSDIPGRNDEKPRGTPAVPSPSARQPFASIYPEGQPLTKTGMLPFLSPSSIILVSPSNEILLIHRMRTSSAF